MSELLLRHRLPGRLRLQTVADLLILPACSAKREDERERAQQHGEQRRSSFALQEKAPGFVGRRTPAKPQGFPTLPREPLAAPASRAFREIVSSECAGRDNASTGWWERKDSNLRRHSQRIYSPPPLPLGTLSHAAPAREAGLMGNGAGACQPERRQRCRRPCRRDSDRFEDRWAAPCHLVGWNIAVRSSRPTLPVIGTDRSGWTSCRAS